MEFINLDVDAHAEYCHLIELLSSRRRIVVMASPKWGGRDLAVVDRR